MLSTKSFYIQLIAVLLTCCSFVVFGQSVSEMKRAQMSKQKSKELDRPGMETKKPMRYEDPYEQTMECRSYCFRLGLRNPDICDDECASLGPSGFHPLTKDEQKNQSKMCFDECLHKGLIPEACDAQCELVPLTGYPPPVKTNDEIPGPNCEKTPYRDRYVQGIRDPDGRCVAVEPHDEKVNKYEDYAALSDGDACGPSILPDPNSWNASWNCKFFAEGDYHPMCNCNVSGSDDFTGVPTDFRGVVYTKGCGSWSNYSLYCREDEVVPGIDVPRDESQCRDWCRRDQSFSSRYPGGCFNHCRDMNF